MNYLSDSRPVFHSEADFQHALTWEIHSLYPSAKVRLEYPTVLHDKNIYIDIWLEFGDLDCAVELKYKTAKLQAKVENELFSLKNQSANDLGRLYYLRDIERLEALPTGMKKYAIFLTNDSAYWEPPKRRNTNDAAFRIHESSILHGELIWLNSSSIEPPIYEANTTILRGTYEMNWENYSTVGDVPSSTFKYLIHQIE